MKKLSFILLFIGMFFATIYAATPFAIPSPTVTINGSSTFTPTFTATLTITATSSVTETHTLTSTLTDTATFTVTATPSNSPTTFPTPFIYYMKKDIEANGPTVWLAWQLYDPNADYAISYGVSLENIIWLTGDNNTTGDTGKFYYPLCCLEYDKNYQIQVTVYTKNPVSIMASNIITVNMGVEGQYDLNLYKIAGTPIATYGPGIQEVGVEGIDQNTFPDIKTNTFVVSVNNQYTPVAQFTQVDNKGNTFVVQVNNQFTPIPQFTQIPLATVIPAATMYAQGTAIIAQATTIADAKTNTYIVSIGNQFTPVPQFTQVDNKGNTFVVEVNNQFTPIPQFTQVVAQNTAIISQATAIADAKTQTYNVYIYGPGGDFVQPYNGFMPIISYGHSKQENCELRQVSFENLAFAANTADYIGISVPINREFYIFFTLIAANGIAWATPYQVVFGAAGTTVSPYSFGGCPTPVVADKITVYYGSNTTTATSSANQVGPVIATGGNDGGNPSASKSGGAYDTGDTDWFAVTANAQVNSYVIKIYNGATQSKYWAEMSWHME